MATASPRQVITIGTLIATDKFSANLLEKIYGKSLDYQNDGDGLRETRNTLNESWRNRDHDLGFQLSEYLKLSMGAQNFSTTPKQNQRHILKREIVAGDNAAVTEYRIFSPNGVNGGFCYVKAAYAF